MADFGLGDLILKEEVLIKTLRWHGLCDMPGSKIETKEIKEGANLDDIAKWIAKQKED